PHHVVADEIDLPFRPGEGEMIGGVAGRGDGFEPPALPLDDIAVLHDYIGLEIAVGAGLRIVLLALEALPRGAVRTFSIDRRAGRRLDTRRVRRVVAMGVRHQDMRHRLALDGIEQRPGMRLVIGTGIDDRDVASAYDVADSAGEGERARIVTEHA